MKIHFSQTGGFAGLTKSLDLDTATLSEDDRVAVDNLLHPLGFFKISISSGDSGPDMFHYSLRIEDGSQKRELSFHDGNCPPSFENLLKFLQAHATYVPVK
jgi:hypothetical protein